MKPRSILTISLLAVILLVGCAPATVPDPAQPAAPVQLTATATELPVEPSPLPTEAQPTVAASEAPPTELPTEVPQPIATSRGSDLEATDPSTVSLSSGELQLVEFFRYT